MIPDLFKSLILSLLNMFLGFLPNADTVAVTKITDFATQFNDIMENASYFFPVNDFMIVAGIIIASELAFLTYKVVKWLIFDVGLKIIK